MFDVEQATKINIACNNITETKTTRGWRNGDRPIVCTESHMQPIGWDYRMGEIYVKPGNLCTAPARVFRPAGNMGFEILRAKKSYFSLRDLGTGQYNTFFFFSPPFAIRRPNTAAHLLHCTCIEQRRGQWLAKDNEDNEFLRTATFVDC